MISLVLFFFQGIRTISSTLFGIIYDQIFLGPVTLWLGTSSLLLVVALTAPSFIPRQLDRALLPIFVALLVTARFAMTLPRLEIRYWSALVVILAGAFVLRVYFERMPREAIVALLGALVVGQLLRNLGATYDLSLRSGWLIVQVIWTLLLLAILISARPHIPEVARPLSLVVGLAFGGFLFLELFLLSIPNGIARWSGWSYAILAPALIAVTALPLFPGMWEAAQAGLGGRTALRFLAVLLLMGGLMLGYFKAGALAGAALLVVQAALLFSMVALFGVGSVERPARLWMTVAVLAFLALSYFNAFAFTYPYTLPAMRGMGWTVYLAAGAAVAVGLLLAPRTMELMPAPAPALVVLGGAGLLVSAFAVLPRAASEGMSGSDLTVASYNIHYGYDENWNFTLETQAETIKASGADVIALQEVDVGRMSSYSVDEAHFLARKLGMRVAYLPTIEHLTGIAILYRGPEAPIRARLLTSEGEQSGIIGATLGAEAFPIEVYSSWIGLEESAALVQVVEALEFIGDAPRVVYAGDFNHERGSAPISHLEQAGYVDPFLALGREPPPATSSSLDPTKQIDFVWVRGLAPSHAEVSASLASDHLLVFVAGSLLP